MRLSASLDHVVLVILTSEAGLASIARIHKPKQINNIENVSNQANMRYGQMNCTQKSLVTALDSIRILR